MDSAAKQQIVERLKQATNILVTVSTNPSVDQLAACIGLTLLLNRMEKHATAVFSGQVPSTLEFLQPEKTIETNTDSLRDFIISLDKEKADKLRYKVEDQVVRIFITPYKTSLSEKDLVFSQGDFNVEVVMALGITDKSQIDAAITAHGRILHDATVIALNTGQAKAPGVGQINWQDPAASSLCEMIVSISEAFGANLIDNQMATAFLTGIVAETNRFSNNKTSPKVMTMSAQLMAAGANQQLIVSKLEPPAPPPPKYNPPTKKVAPVTVTAELKSAGQPEATLEDGTLSIAHSEEPKPAAKKVSGDEIMIDKQGNLISSGTPVAASPAPPAEPAAPTPAASPAPPPPPEEEKLPGPHSLLTPNARPPALESVFTATAQPEWENPYNDVPIDPLSGEPAKPEILSRGGSPAASSNPPSLNSARNAVDSALAAAPFDPGFAPSSAALNAAPLDADKAHGASMGIPEAADAAPAPPFPPPLTPTNGVVIPPASGTSAAK